MREPHVDDRYLLGRLFIADLVEPHTVVPTTPEDLQVDGLPMDITLTIAQWRQWKSNKNQDHIYSDYVHLLSRMSTSAVSTSHF